MNKRNRLVALTVALTFIFVTLFSACFIAVEVDHDCAGDDCPICCQISICENALRTVGIAASTVIYTGVSGIFILAVHSFAKKLSNNASLVTLKVKLSD